MTGARSRAAQLFRGIKLPNPARNTICLWYDHDAEEAARFYAKTFPDSSVGAAHRVLAGSHNRVILGFARGLHEVVFG